MTTPYPFPDLDALLNREVGAQNLRDYGYTLAGKMLADGKAGPRFTAANGEVRFEWGDLLRWATDDPAVVWWKEAMEAARRMGFDEPPPEDAGAISAAVTAAFSGDGGITPSGISWVRYVWGEAPPQAGPATAETVTAAQN